MWCKRILLAYDGSAASKNARRLGVDVAKQDPDRESIAGHILKI